MQTKKKLKLSKLGIQNTKWLLAGIILLGIEIIIATYFHGNFIRNTLGDFLVVILIYSFIRAFTNIAWKKIALGVLLLANAIEIFQWLEILQLLHIKSTTTTAIVLGSSFDWGDMLAYTLGVITVQLIENLNSQETSN